MEEDAAALHRALEDCRAEAEAQRAQVELYAAVKDRLSGIELSAHRLAAEVEQAAALEAENVQRQARENVLSLQMQYELAVMALEAGRRQMTEQLCDMQMALDALAPVLEQAGRTLVSLCEDRCRPPEQREEPAAGPPAARAAHTAPRPAGSPPSAEGPAGPAEAAFPAEAEAETASPMAPDRDDPPRGEGGRRSAAAPTRRRESAAKESQ